MPRLLCRYIKETLTSFTDVKLCSVLRFHQKEHVSLCTLTVTSYVAPVFTNNLEVDGNLMSQQFFC